MWIISIIVIVLCCFENSRGNTCSHHEKGSLSSCYNKGKYEKSNKKNEVQHTNILIMRDCNKLLKGIKWILAQVRYDTDYIAATDTAYQGGRHIHISAIYLDQ